MPQIQSQARKILGYARFIFGWFVCFGVFFGLCFLLLLFGLSGLVSRL